MRFEATTTGDVSLRELAAPDLDELQALFERCVDYFELHEGRATTPTEARDEWSAVPDGTPRSQKHVVGLFAPDLAGVVEVVRDWPRPATWNIGLLLLDPGVRRRGLGTRALAAVDAWARRTGADRLRITVNTANTGGLAFWRRHGFEPVPAVLAGPGIIALERSLA